MQYLVANENVLGYLIEDIQTNAVCIQILASKITMGAIHIWRDGYVYFDPANVRKATKKDFDSFNVMLPPDFELALDKTK